MFIVIGHNNDGGVRYIQTASAPGVTATGITSDRNKATVFDSWSAAFQHAVYAGATWRYSWRVRDAIVKPCSMRPFECPRCGHEYSDRTPDEEIRMTRARRSYEDSGICSDRCEE